MAQPNDKYLFNNTAIGLVGILSTLQKSNGIDIANFLLISPLLLHAETLKFLRTPNVRIRSIEEFLVKSPKTFINFPDRYESLLSMSFNCLTIAIEAGYLILNNNFVYPTEKLLKYKFHSKLGLRANELTKAAAKLAHLLAANSNTLYLNLRINL
ncbi:hypothetical protein I2I05_04290 [Hymenobacter sp. BT683]|uniref:RNase III domain-containing protein n=1 Tax=Hymenobacter jeongseonensis TaxID=2791027 RepID=A0ABS0IE51_9BACT|nr:three component ABC system middle component [Hymenobacter jeongseonensis]MBF9236608.1 hypothetical protein [Hymenobacter jeongseonensis]